jgi:hypothetical protein
MDSSTLLRIAEELETARIVVVDGVPLPLTYWRAPDDVMTAGDIVLEAGDQGEVLVMRDELDEAAEVAPGFFRLRSGHTLRFLSPVTVH